MMKQKKNKPPQRHADNFWKELQSLISNLYTFRLQHLGQALPADSGRLGEEATTRRARAQGQDTVLHHSETELQKRVFSTIGRL